MPSTAKPSIIPCPKCRTSLPWSALATPGPVDCHVCRTSLESTVFPALFKGLEEGHRGETLMEDGLASCFYHPDKKAVVTCESCGRFLCALCDITLAEQHLCTACLQAGKRRGENEQLNTHRILHDDVALAVAGVPLLAWPLTLISAPIAVFLVIKHWKSPSSIIPRTKFRMILALILALLQIGGWILFAGSIWLDWL